MMECKASREAKGEDERVVEEEKFLYTRTSESKENIIKCT
jgi:hypothetical protein